MPEFSAHHAEALLWVAAQLALGVLGLSLWPQLKPIVGDAAELFATGARLAHSLLIPYLALLIGSVSARDAGLVGADALPYTLADWGRALAWAALFCASAFGLSTWRRLAADVSPVNALLDEARWAFYRGAAIGWAGPLWGLSLGAGLALFEWSALRGIGASLGLRERAPLRAGWFVRAGLSMLTFAFTQNIWVTMAAGLLMTAGLQRWSAQYD